MTSVLMKMQNQCNVFVINHDDTKHLDLSRRSRYNVNKQCSGACRYNVSFLGAQVTDHCNILVSFKEPNRLTCLLCKTVYKQLLFEKKFVF